MSTIVSHHLTLLVSLWGEAIRQVMHILIKVPIKYVRQTPYDLWIQ